MPDFRTADGRVLSYRTFGAGPLLVCHGGGPGFSSLYLGDLGSLGDDFTIVALDPRGTGASSRPSEPRAYAFDDYVDDVEALRAHLGAESIALFGHSHGGVVAGLYAARYRERTRALVLASTLARFQAEQTEAMEEAMEQRAHEPWYADAREALEAEQAGAFDTESELTELVLREMPFYFTSYGDAERAYVESLRADVVNADTLRLFNTEIFPTFDTRGELATVSCPTLVVYGDRDFITGPACAEDLLKAIPHAEHAVLHDVGHMIFVEAPQQFRAVISSFLRGN